MVREQLVGSCPYFRCELWCVPRHNPPPSFQTTDFAIESSGDNFLECWHGPHSWKIDCPWKGVSGRWCVSVLWFRILSLRVIGGPLCMKWISWHHFSMRAVSDACSGFDLATFGIFSLFRPREYAQTIPWPRKCRISADVHQISLESFNFWHFS